MKDRVSRTQVLRRIRVFRAADRERFPNPNWGEYSVTYTGPGGTSLALYASEEGPEEITITISPVEG